MKASQIHRRLENLTAKIRPNGRREFTLEELCREYWRLDKRGFLALMKRDCQGLGVFAAMFEREDAECAAHGPGGVPGGVKGFRTKKAASRR
jgi:hypothetical protein